MDGVCVWGGVRGFECVAFTEPALWQDSTTLLNKGLHVLSASSKYKAVHSQLHIKDSSIFPVRFPSRCWEIHPGRQDITGGRL